MFVLRGLTLWINWLFGFATFFAYAVGALDVTRAALLVAFAVLNLVFMDATWRAVQRPTQRERGRYTDD